MRAAVVSELGRPPEPRDVAEPEAGAGEVLVDVVAASLNPLDLSVGSGRFYGGHPRLPYVAGCEAVGRVRGSGALVWVHGGGFGVKRDGGLAELAVAPESALVEVPDQAAPRPRQRSVSRVSPDGFRLPGGRRTRRYAGPF